MLWSCIDMRLADDRREHLPTRLTSAPGGYSMPVPRSGVIPTSLARVPGRTQKSPGGKFRVSPRNLLCGVSLPGRATTGVGPHRSVASFDDLNQASDEVDGVRTVIPFAANSVDFHGGWLVHTFLLG